MFLEETKTIYVYAHIRNQKPTNIVSAESAIGEPASGSLVDKISPIWLEIALEKCLYVVVISRVDCGVSKHQKS